jgi:hypothetical protein
MQGCRDQIQASTVDGNVLPAPGTLVGIQIGRAQIQDELALMQGTKYRFPNLSDALQPAPPHAELDKLQPTTSLGRVKRSCHPDRIYKLQARTDRGSYDSMPRKIYTHNIFCPASNATYTSSTGILLLCTLLSLRLGKWAG